MADRSSALPPLSPVLAPHGVYVDGNDHLLVTTIASLASTDVIVSGRLLDERGRPVPFREQQRANSDRTAKQTLVRLACGWLTDVTAIAASAAPQVGQAFVRVDLVRGDLAVHTVLATLMQGMVTAAQRLAWPGSPIASTVERPGALRSVTGADPAAGAEISETVPTGARWRLHAMSFSLTTSAAAANREVSITFDDGTTLYYAAAPDDQHIESFTARYAVGRGGARGGATQAPIYAITIPDLVLPAGHRIRTSTTNLQAGDNFTAPQMLVEEWLEGA